MRARNSGHPLNFVYGQERVYGRFDLSLSWSIFLNYFSLPSISRWLKVSSCLSVGGGSWPCIWQRAAKHVVEQLFSSRRTSVTFFAKIQKNQKLKLQTWEKWSTVSGGWRRLNHTELRIWAKVKRVLKSFISIPLWN